MDLMAEGNVAVEQSLAKPSLPSGAIGSIPIPKNDMEITRRSIHAAFHPAFADLNGTSAVRNGSGQSMRRGSWQQRFARASTSRVMVWQTGQNQ